MNMKIIFISAGRHPIAVSMLAGVAALLLGACGASAVVHPTAQDAEWASAKWPGTTVGELETGRALYTSKCAGCHRLPDPNAKTPEQWPTVVDEMADRAKLTAADRDLMLRYLSSASERLRESGGNG
ncbi:MAG TPA: cytochrome c [Polyangiaceae bacterium]|nr:cytochrome c [Polyangiaceae bacterium]